MFISNFRNNCDKNVCFSTRVTQLQTNKIIFVICNNLTIFCHEFVVGNKVSSSKKMRPLVDNLGSDHYYSFVCGDERLKLLKVIFT